MARYLLRRIAAALVALLVAVALGLRISQSATDGTGLDHGITAGAAIRTAVLVISALAVAVIVALGLSLSAALIDSPRLTGIVKAANAAVLPLVAVGVVLVVTFGVHPHSGDADGSSVVGILLLGMPAGSILARRVGNALDDELRRPHIVTARSLGIPHRSVVVDHALRNVLRAGLSEIAALIAALLGGAILVETLVGLRGLGLLAEQAVAAHDHRLVAYLVVLSVAVVVLVGLVADAARVWSDPRLRAAGE